MQTLYNVPVMIRSLYHPARLAAVIMLLLIGAGLASATMVRPLDLQQLADSSELIIHASVRDQQVRYDESSKRVVTLISFDVIETLKGSAADTHTIKQLGGRHPDTGRVHRVHGMPGFINGKQYIVFLPPVSRLGFSSPVGLSYGQYAIDVIDGISTVADPQRVAASELNPRVGNVAAARTVPGNKVTLDSFKQAIRQRLDGR